MHLVEVAHGVLVQDDEVDLQSDETPVLLRLQNLRNEGQVVGLDDADEHDREVTRDSVAVKTALSERALRKDLPRLAQGRIGEEDA